MELRLNKFKLTILIAILLLITFYLIIVIKYNHNLQETLSKAKNVSLIINSYKLDNEGVLPKSLSDLKGYYCCDESAIMYWDLYKNRFIPFVYNSKDNYIIKSSTILRDGYLLRPVKVVATKELISLAIPLNVKDNK